MPLRILSLILMSAVLAGAAPSKVSKEKKQSLKQPVRTWARMIDYVMKNGGDDSLKAPATRTLGYDSDEVSSKSMGLDFDKSKDRKEHNIHVITTKNDAGDSIPKEIVLTTTLLKEHDSQKDLDGYEIRMTLVGVPISGLHVTGIVGHVVQQRLLPDSKELVSIHRAETAFYLKEIDLGKLTK